MGRGMTTRKTVDAWMSDLEPPLREIAQALRQIVLDADPALKEAVKWGNPVYEKNGPVCYLAATVAYVNLGFFKGASLVDPKGRIEGTGKKMSHVKVRSLGDIEAKQFRSWVCSAVGLNDQ